MLPASSPSSKTTDPLRDLSVYHCDLTLRASTLGSFGISVVFQPCNWNMGNPAPDSFSLTYELSLNRSPGSVWGPEVMRWTLCLWKEMELAACGEVCWEELGKQDPCWNSGCRGCPLVFIQSL